MFDIDLSTSQVCEQLFGELRLVLSNRAVYFLERFSFSFLLVRTPTVSSYSSSSEQSVSIYFSTLEGVLSSFSFSSLFLQYESVSFLIGSLFGVGTTYGLGYAFFGSCFLV